MINPTDKQLQDYLFDPTITLITKLVDNQYNYAAQTNCNKL